jgi:hypothetical protein
VSNATGNYQIPFLTPGSYRVTAELTGFKRFVRDNIEIRVGETVDLPIQMEIGQVTETVEVTASTPLLDTASSSLGQVVDTIAVGTGGFHAPPALWIAARHTPSA